MAGHLPYRCHTGPRFGKSGTSVTFEIWKVRVRDALAPRREPYWGPPLGEGKSLDFYPDWCTSCKEMEATTFLDPVVRKALGGTVLLRADVTANDAANRELLKRFGIYGPPTITFYGRNGQERSRYRVVGYLDGPQFAAAVHAAFGSQRSS